MSSSCTIELVADVYFAFVYFRTILAASILFSPKLANNMNNLHILCGLITAIRVLGKKRVIINVFPPSPRNFHVVKIKRTLV